MNIKKEILTGKTNEHLEPLEGSEFLIHQETLPALVSLRELAARSGMELRVASAFRDYEKQLRIWNAKATGQRTLLDGRGRPVEFSQLSPEQVVFSILRWSALPGASRHHWGTDIDVFDASSLPNGENIQLIPQEAKPGAHQARFSMWLEKTIPQLGFFRPYASDRGGVSPEWWHLSYSPVSTAYYGAYSFELFEQTIKGSDMELKDVVLAHLRPIYDCFVMNISPG